MREESERLELILEGLGHVCVVEEWVSSGRNLAKAHKLLSDAGTPHISSVRGLWDPMGIREGEVNDPAAFMASEHSTGPYLRQCGEAAYQINLAANQQI